MSEISTIGGCLEHYARRKPKGFVQMDGFCVDQADAVMRPDEDGDCLFSGGTTELMYGADVRVLIGTDDYETAARLLKKLSQWLEKDPARMNDMPKAARAENSDLPF